MDTLFGSQGQPQVDGLHTKYIVYSLSLSLALFLHSDDCIYVCNINEYIYIYINIICSYYDYKIHDTNRYGHTGEGVRLKLQS